MTIYCGQSSTFLPENSFSDYLFSGEGLGPVNLGVLSQRASLTRCLGVPVALLGDFNMTLAELRPWLSKWDLHPGRCEDRPTVLATGGRSIDHVFV